MKKIRQFLLITSIFLMTSFSTLIADEVVVYTSVDDVFARPITEKFEQKTGIKVKLVTDTEETKSTGLLNRLIAEKKRPIADVFWSGDPIRAAILKSKGVSSVYRSNEAKGLAAMYSDSDGHWTGFSARARIILYNKNLVKKGHEPTSIMDLLNPEFKGKVCMANPLFGTTSMHAAAIFVSFGENKAKKYFSDLKNNQLKLLSSNGEVRRRVSSGDCAYGITDTDDAYTALRDKKPVGVIFPDKKGMGTLIVPNAAVLIANGPNPKPAKRFIDFLLSPETEEALASGEAAQMPLREHLKGPRHFPALKDLQPMKVNYSELADTLESLSKGFFREWAGSF